MKGGTQVHISIKIADATINMKTFFQEIDKYKNKNKNKKLKKI